jgi:GNAT superfamily N-acetyltransferase
LGGLGLGAAGEIHLGRGEARLTLLALAGVGLAQQAPGEAVVLFKGGRPLQLVDGGVEPGLVGYLDGAPVGWISLGPREEYLKLQRSRVMKPVDDAAVWSVVCTYVAKTHRGMGLQHRLLRAAIDYARDHRVRLLEAYPVDKPERSHDDFMFFGSRSLYERAGFTEVVRRSPTRVVMRRAIRPRRRVEADSGPGSRLR